MPAARDTLARSSSGMLWVEKSGAVWYNPITSQERGSDMAGLRKASEIRAAKKQLRAVSSVRRSVFYLMRAILTVLAAATVSIFAFLSAARVSNAYILVNEGMPLRAESILKNGSVNDLAAYFTSDCIEGDALQRETSAAPYAGAAISSYQYDLSIANLHLLPWHVNTYVDVVEQILAIRGTMPVESGVNQIPDWMPRKYRLDLVKVDGRWYIGSITLLELNPKIDPPATPDPYAEPIPMVTPSPAPTPTPFPIE